VAQEKSGDASKARAILVARREKAVSKLATVYSSKAVADLISISDAIEILSRMEKENRPRAQQQADIGLPLSTR
jgi:hypothetical protein